MVIVNEVLLQLHEGIQLFYYFVVAGRSSDNFCQLQWYAYNNPHENTFSAQINYYPMARNANNNM